MKFATFAMQRVVAAVATLWLVSIAAFVIVTVLPGDVAQVILGDGATPEQLAVVRANLGLDQPLWQRYLDWIGGAVTGDFGNSLIYGVPVSELIGSRLFNSAVLAFSTLAVSVVIGVLLGAYSASRQGSRTDRFISGGIAALFSIPDFVIGVGLILVFSLWLGWLPGTSLVAPGTNPLANPQALVLPVATLTCAYFAYMSQITRASMVDALGSDYVRTARLKGLPDRVVIVKHALRNAMLPTMSLMGMSVGSIIGGVVVVEAVFSYAGIGQLMVDAVTRRDVPTILGTVLLSTVLYSIGNLMADLSSFLLNPRLRAA